MKYTMFRIALILLLAMPFAVLSQQRPQYSQYMLNNYLLNPAISGIENYTDIKLASRTQWTSIEGAPQTYYLSAHTILAKNKDKVTVGAEGDKVPAFATGGYKRGIYRAKDAKAHHGAGVIFLHDKLGPFSRTDISFSYAYHQPLTGRVKLSAGVATGISQVSLDGDELQFANPGDAVAGGWTTFRPDLSLGLWLYSDLFYAGASATDLISNTITFGDEQGNNAKQHPHFFFTGAYKLAEIGKIAVVPSVMVKLLRPLPVSVDYNLRAIYDNKLWLGASYRQQDSFAVLAGLTINRTFDASYTYDSGVNAINAASHEILVGIRLQSKYKILTPKIGW